MGADTGIDIHQLSDVGRRAEQIIGHRLRSNVIRAGPVIHGESTAAKEPAAGASVAVGEIA